MLIEVPLDITKPMVCCGCAAIGCSERSPGEKWGSWYRTKVIFIGNGRYQGAAHCGKAGCPSEEMSWSLSDLESNIESCGSEAGFVIMKSQQEVLTEYAWKPVPFNAKLLTVRRPIILEVS